MIFFQDPDHSEEEDRFIMVGHSQHDKQLFVVHIALTAYESSVHGQSLLWKGQHMKADWEDSDEMRKEFDLSKLKRIPNPFFQKFSDLRLVSLDFDVAKAFPDSEAVNVALRRLISKEDPNDKELAKAS